MKKVFLMIALMIPLAAQAEKRDVSGFCGAVGDLAKTVMEKRLAGMSMRSMVAIAGDNPLTTEMVMQAYGSPAYQTETAQERAIREFETKWYLDCLRNTK